MKFVVISLMVASPANFSLVFPPRLGLFCTVGGGVIVQLAVRKAVDKRQIEPDGSNLNVLFP